MDDEFTKINSDYFDEIVVHLFLFLIIFFYEDKMLYSIVYLCATLKIVLQLGFSCWCDENDLQFSVFDWYMMWNERKMFIQLSAMKKKSLSELDCSLHKY